MGYRTNIQIVLKPGVALPDFTLTDDFGGEREFVQDCNPRVVSGGTYMFAEWNEVYVDGEVTELCKQNMEKLNNWFDSMNPEEFYMLRGGCDEVDQEGNDIIIDERGEWDTNPFLNRDPNYPVSYFGSAGY